MPLQLSRTVPLSRAAVVFDLMNTALWGVKGHWATQAQIYRDILREIFETYSSAPPTPRPLRKGFILRHLQRAKLSVTKDVPDELRYPIVNVMVLRALYPEFFPRLGAEEQRRWGSLARDRFLAAEGHYLDSQMARLFNRLRKVGVLLAIGSNQETGYVEEHTRTHKLHQWFFHDCRFTSQMLHVEKPDPKFVEVIAERLGRDPADVIYVGDSATSDAPMLGSGCQVILFSHDNHFEADTTSPEFLARHAEALRSGALHIVRSPRKVGDIILASLSRDE